MEKKVMTIIDTDGKKTDYEILLAFKWMKTNKNYIVYTDNTYNEDGELKIYAAIYYPGDDTKLDLVESDEEWDEIEDRLEELQE